MGVKVLKNVKILLGGYDLSGDMNQAAINAEAEVLEKTTFGSSGWRERLSGMLSANFEAEGYFQAGAAAVDTVLEGKLGTTSGDVLTIIPHNSQDETAYFGKMLVGTYEPFPNSIGEVHSFNVSAEGMGPMVRGRLMLGSSAARTASGNSTGDNLGAMSAGQSLYAALHTTVVANTSDSLTVTVQGATESTFAAPTTHISFSAVTAIGAQWGAPVAYSTGNLDTYFRVNYTITGATGPSYTFAVAVGIQ